MKKLREPIKRGTEGFPFGFYNKSCNTSHSCMVDFHYHKDIDIFQAVTGTARVIIDNKEYVTQPDHIYCINPMENHAFYSHTPCQWRTFVFPRFVIELPPDHLMMKRLINPIFNGTLRMAHCVKDAELSSLLEEISHLQKRTDENMPLIVSDLLRFLGIMERDHHLHPAPPISIDAPKIQRILDYLDQHYRERITLTQLAEHINMHPTSFCRYFKKEMNSTPFCYIHQLRIREAQVLLWETTMPIIDIAIQVGFDNISFFTRTFKKLTGLTPYQFRRSK